MSKYKAYDIKCSNQDCLQLDEDLLNDEELAAGLQHDCKVCGSKTDIMYMPSNTYEMSIFRREVKSRYQHMRLRQQGRLPWRKSSHSQTGNE